MAEARWQTERAAYVPPDVEERARVSRIIGKIRASKGWVR
jgi:hypothetical protein